MKTPKLLKTTASAFGLARKTTDADAIEAAIAEARALAASGEREEAEAQARYRDALLADDGDPAVALAEMQVAKIKRDRGEAQAAELTGRLATVRESEARAARKVVHDDAAAKCSAIRRRLPEEYRLHAGALRALLRDLGEAEAALDRAAPFMGEFGEIRSPEADLRGFGGTAEEIIDLHEVELWVLDGGWEPLPEDRQHAVVPFPDDHTRGRIPFRGSGGLDYGHGADGCVLRRFTRVRYRAGLEHP